MAGRFVVSQKEKEAMATLVDRVPVGGKVANENLPWFKFENSV